MNLWYCLVLLIPQVGSLAYLTPCSADEQASQASWLIYLNAKSSASAITTLFHWRGGGFPEVWAGRRCEERFARWVHWLTGLWLSYAILRFLLFNWLSFLKSLYKIFDGFRTCSILADAQLTLAEILVHHFRSSGLISCMLFPIWSTYSGIMIDVALI